MHFTKVQIIIKYNKFLWLLNVNVNFVFFVVHAAMCRIVLIESISKVVIQQLSSCFVVISLQ